ncbi:retrovirus-related pol polyprotein from transposon TNT 1-94 [Tanacetum coccineum]
MDVKSVFLNEKLKEEVYVKQPLGFESNEFPNHVCKMEKAHYGLKQVPRAWSTSTKLCKQFAKLMTQRYEMSMMGVLTYFLGFQIKLFERGISINQENYVKDLLKKYDINGSSLKTPMVPLNKYLKGTPSLGLWYPKCSGFDLKGYSDSDNAGCNMVRKSTPGVCQLLGVLLVCWSAKKKQSVAMSSAEAEYVAAVRCCANILWMKMVAKIHKEAKQAAGGPTSLGATSKEGAYPQLSSASTLVVAKIHKEVKQETSGPTSLGATSKEGAYPQLSSGCDALGMDEGTQNYSLDHVIAGTNPSVLKSAFFILDSPRDEPIIILDESEEEETKRYKDTHAISQDEPKDTSILHPLSSKSVRIQELMAQVLLLQSQKLKLEQQKEKAEVEVAFLNPYIQMSTSLHTL